MTFRDKFIGLSATAGALIVIIALGLVFSPENNQRRAASGKLLADGKQSAASEITLSVGKESITLRKNGKGWTFEKGGASLMANSAKVTDFLSALSGVKELYKVSSKKDDAAKFGFGADSEKRVAIQDAKGKTLSDFAVGSSAGTGNGIYVRLSGKDSVYTAKNSFDSYLKTDDRTWANLKLISDGTKADDIQGVKIDAKLAATSGAEGINLSYEIDRDARKGWKVKGNDATKLDRSAVESYVKDLVGFEADSVVSDKQEEAQALLDSPAIRVTLTTGKGTEIELLVSAADAENRYVIKRSDGSQLFYTNHFTLSSHLRSVASLTEVKVEKKAKAESKAKK
jgi:hypothetical protein